MIRFTQYLRPNGEKRLIEISRPPEIEAKAKRLVEYGCRLEAEVLTTQEISLTVEVEVTGGDVDTLAHEIVGNGPPVLDAVDRLVCKAFDTLGLTIATE